MKKVIPIILCFLLSSPVLAEELTLLGTSDESISISRPNQLYPQGFKDIKVDEYELSDTLQAQLYQQASRRLEQINFLESSQNSNLPKKVQLGMSNVPVLDQGIHGSCAAFAVTAAIDAVLKRGDYVSQLCLLQLGNYLHKQHAGPSGWSGASIDTHIDRIGYFGVISIEKQHLYGCGGEYWYPSYFFTPKNEMLPDEYTKLSNHSLTSKLQWKRLIRNPRLQREIASKLLLQELKIALNSGSRVVVSMLLPKNYWFSLGATGKYHYRNDTWVMTSDIAEELKHSKRMGGHAMVLTGYDDNAKAVDSSGHVHQGLFKFRNSWTSWVGDWGDYYVSYDYAEVLLNRGMQLMVQ